MSAATPYFGIDADIYAAILRDGHSHGERRAADPATCGAKFINEAWAVATSPESKTKTGALWWDRVPMMFDEDDERFTLMIERDGIVLYFRATRELGSKGRWTTAIDTTSEFGWSFTSKSARWALTADSASFVARYQTLDNGYEARDIRDRLAANSKKAEDLARQIEANQAARKELLARQRALKAEATNEMGGVA